MEKILTFLFALLLYSCSSQKEQIIIENPTPCEINPLDCVTTDSFEVVWQQPLNSIDTGGCSSMIPVVYKNNVAFSLLFCGNYETVFMRDGQTGELLWQWEDYFKPSEFVGNSGVYRYSQYLIGSSHDDIYAVNLENGQTLWKTIRENGNPNINIVKNNLYHTQSRPGIGRVDSISVLTRTNVLKNQWDTVYTLHGEDGYSANIMPPVSWFNPKGENILFFQNRSLNWTTLDGRIDLIAYNLSTKKDVFRLNDIDPEGNSTVIPPLLVDNRVYFRGLFTLYCYELPTGNLLWQHRFERQQDHLLHSNVLLEDGKLIVNPSGDVVYAFDPLDGTIIWVTENSGSTPNNMVYHDGIVYFTSVGDGKLHAIDIKTGEQIWKMDSPNVKKGFPNAAFSTVGLSVNPKLGYLYTADNYFAMCIKLPER